MTRKTKMAAEPRRDYRGDFPLLQQTMHGKPLAYLDTAASAQKPRVVVNMMDEIQYFGYSNIHRGLYEISQKLTEEFEDVRWKVARFIGAASEEEIVFTRNATEGVNLVAQSWGRTFLKEGDEIILSELEHHANIVPWQILREQSGIVIRVLPIDGRGVLDLGALPELLSDRTKMVGVTHISNALGVVNPVSKIIKIVRKFNPEVKVLVDGAQGIVHGHADVRAMDADFYVFTGHKLYGPTGVGVLYGRYELLEAMPPYQGGGDMIERVSFGKTAFREPPARFEAGTPPIVQVLGLGAAIDYVSAVGRDFIHSHEAELLAYMTARLSEVDGLKIYGAAPRNAGIVSFTMDCATPADVGMVLDQCGVAVRAGHHCCMPLMEKLGVPATVRASLGLYSNREDIDALVAGLRKVSDLFQ